MEVLDGQGGPRFDFGGFRFAVTPMLKSFAFIDEGLRSTSLLWGVIGRRDLPSLVSKLGGSFYNSEKMKNDVEIRSSIAHIKGLKT